MELVLVDKLIEAIGTSLRTELPGAAMVLRPLPRNAMVKVVPEYIGQILHNLVENATKYSPRDSVIELGSRATDDGVEVWVADRGIGIKDPGALFKLFSREDQAEKIASGMGLGLAVCRTLVEAQSGRIWAEQREGGGTIVRFVLPRSETP